MDKPIIDPSTLSEEQREAIRADYYEDVAADEYNAGYQSALRNIFGSNFFKKGE